MENAVHSDKVIGKNLSRREFLKFMGMGALTLAASGVVAKFSPWQKALAGLSSRLPFTPLKPNFADALTLASGFDFRIFAGWGDALSSTRPDVTFGYNNDYLAFMPLDSSGHDALMMVNHESVTPLFVSGYPGKNGEGEGKTKTQLQQERMAVGVSLLRVKKMQNQWRIDKSDNRNRRINGTTPIPFAWKDKIAGASEALGLIANCAGGVTPWGTFLTCEENFDYFYGDVLFEDRKSRKLTFPDDDHLGWSDVDPQPPEHFGWVAEVNPHNGTAKKLVALGRFCHEGATVVKNRDGRVTVYMGDDTADQHLYKFISDKPYSLESGTLYAANLEKGEWIALDHTAQPALQKHFQDQTEVLIYTRAAARMLGATPLDRPEDIEINPRNGDILVSLTNNSGKKNFYGSILKIREENNNPLALRFVHETFLTGGETVGFACPDNLVFDRKGNLWMVTDISGKKIGNSDYRKFGHNGLFYIPMEGPNAGKAFQVASAPAEAEFTGLAFAPDGKSLFLSVQHPGELSTKNNITSHWPLGGLADPKPCVVEMNGSALNQLLG